MAMLRPSPGAYGLSWIYFFVFEFEEKGFFVLNIDIAARHSSLNKVVFP